MIAHNALEAYVRLADYIKIVVGIKSLLAPAVIQHSKTKGSQNNNFKANTTKPALCQGEP